MWRWWGGLSIALGFFTRIWAFVASGQMAVAYVQAHLPRGFWPVQHGGEPAVLFCFIFLYLAAVGTGKWGIRKTSRPQVPKSQVTPAR